MKEEEASLMIVRHAIEMLNPEKKQRVNACVAALYAVMDSYEKDDAGLALMLVAAEVAAC